MDPVTGALLGAGISGVSSAFGQFQANTSNKKLAREQMDYQERMSGSQFQRAVKDLRAAGLNPILAAGAQASSPAGSMAKMEDVLGKGVASALEFRRMKKELEAADSVIKLQNDQAALARQQAIAAATSAQNVMADTAIKKATLPAVTAESILKQAQAKESMPYVVTDKMAQNWKSTALQVGRESMREVNVLADKIRDKGKGVVDWFADVYRSHSDQLKNYNKKHGRKK